MADSLAVSVADSALAQVANFTTDSVDWGRECYYVLVNIREDLNWLLAIALGVIAYHFTKFLKKEVFGKIGKTKKAS